MPAAAFPMPELWPELHYLFDASQVLAKRRPIQLGSIGSIPVSDITSYAREFDIPVRELLRICDALDIEFFEFVKSTKPPPTTGGKRK